MIGLSLIFHDIEIENVGILLSILKLCVVRPRIRFKRPPLAHKVAGIFKGYQVYNGAGFAY